MIFVDTSFYVSILNPLEPRHEYALELARRFGEKEPQITSRAVLGEVLTIGSMRYDRKISIEFVESIINSNTTVLLEDKDMLTKAFTIFKKIPQKDVSWVDCYSFAIIEEYKINKVFSFDKDFKRHTNAEVLK